jgi:glycosyltransferase involved in cell wall biosynthesis
MSMPVILQPPAPPAAEGCELTVLMPCLNEAETLAVCVGKAMGFLRRHGVKGEVLVADNGSTDGSQAIAAANGARVVQVPVRGYGGALGGGIAAAAGTYIIMGDADDSYDFANLMPFLEKLRAGAELVMGNRFKGGIKPGAMPPLHRYLGNPVLTTIGRLFFGSPSGDFHCGLRGFRKDSIQRLDLRTTGMEFASEMVVKATLFGLNIVEVPTTLSPDGRSRPPHLRSWRDGWRHLRFLLLYSPRWLFFYPGIVALLTGLLGMTGLAFGPVHLGIAVLDIHTLLVASLLAVLGTQAITFAVLAKEYATQAGLIPREAGRVLIADPVALEAGLLLGGFLVLVGLAGVVGAVAIWGSVNFGDLDAGRMMRLLVPATTAMAIGFQIVLAAFFKGVIGLKRS